MRPAVASVGCLALALALAGAGDAARAQPAPAPHGAHPRLLLDDGVRAAWKQAAKRDGSAVRRAIDHCAAARKDPHEYDHDNYMALDWSSHLQACLVAWAVTGDDADARTAMRFFGAMLDDLVDVGDGKGGDQAARRDSGFAIRAMGPPTALAYDWLHDHPLMTEALRAKARQRFAAWTSWYLEHGYRARVPGTNYHAGWLTAATFIAIAEAGEAGDDGDKLWRLVADELWGKDMAAAFGDGGILEGGDWVEGWQYGPLSVAELAMSARVAAAAGIHVDGVGKWLEALLARTVHALGPDGRTYAVGDTEFEEPGLPPSPLPLAAVILGDAPPAAQMQAMGELMRLGLTDKTFPLVEALAESRALTPQPVPRATWPTSYLAGGAGMLYARTSWQDDAVWLAVHCNRAVDADHTHPDAGDVVVTRGKDEVVVDPSPYGTQSTLTSNAPTVEDDHLPEEYKPSQGYWSSATGFSFAAQTASGVLAVRCDYADQYRFQERPSDVKRALRDVVVVPWGSGGDASVVVIDRAATADERHAMHLRFRTPGPLVLDAAAAGGARATATVGGSALAITRVAATGGAPEVRHLPKGDCFAAGIVRGRCDASRFASDEYRVVVPGPAPAAIHVLDLFGRGGAGVTASATGDAIRVVRLAPRAAGAGAPRFVVVADEVGDTLAYQAPAPDAAGAEHVVLDTPAAADGTVGVSAAPASGGCAITLSASGGDVRVAASPAAFALDAKCHATNAAPRRAGGAPAIVSHPAPVARRGSGCCGAQAAPDSPVAMSLVVLAALTRLRRRRMRHARDAGADAAS